MTPLERVREELAAAGRGQDLMWMPADRRQLRDGWIVDTTGPGVALLVFERGELRPWWQFPDEEAAAAFLRDLVLDQPAPVRLTSADADDARRRAAAGDEEFQQWVAEERRRRGLDA